MNCHIKKTTKEKEACIQMSWWWFVRETLVHVCQSTKKCSETESNLFFFPHNLQYINPDDLKTKLLYTKFEASRITAMSACLHEHVCVRKKLQGVVFAQQQGAVLDRVSLRGQITACTAALDEPVCANRIRLVYEDDSGHIRNISCTTVCKNCRKTD